MFSNIFVTVICFQSLLICILSIKLSNRCYASITKVNYIFYYVPRRARKISRYVMQDCY